MNDHMHWRYATKKFDPSKKIPEQELTALLDVARLSPSSCGLQPWKFFVIHDTPLRQQLRPHAHHQAQITDADTLIVLCTYKTMDEHYVKHYIDRIAQVRGVAKESLLGYENMMMDLITGRSPEAVEQWMKGQVYIALGVLLNECAHRKIDACPMEGFDHVKFDEILGLPQAGLESVVLCAVGYRAADDPYAALQKVRFDKNEVFIEI